MRLYSINNALTVDEDGIENTMHSRSCSFCLTLPAQYAAVDFDS